MAVTPSFFLEYTIGKSVSERGNELKYKFKITDIFMSQFSLLNKVRLSMFNTFIESYPSS